MKTIEQNKFYLDDAIYKLQILENQILILENKLKNNENGKK